jgi:hypothetical protein
MPAAPLRRPSPRLGGAVTNMEVSAVAAITVLAFAASAAVNLRGRALGFDFRGNEWLPAKAVLHGASPYAHLTPAYLRAHSNTFLLPPLVALLATPLALLPFHVAFAVWTVLSAAAFVAALRLVGLRNRGCFVLACLSFPLLDCLMLGQLSGFLALGTALAWRWRDRPRVSGFLVAAMIVAKLLAWPLLLWLLFTRRWRAAATAAAGAIALLTASWAAIGFVGLRGYPQELRLDARAFGERTHSLVAFATSLGASYAVGELVAAMIVIALLAWTWHCASSGADLQAFAAATAAGIYASPVVHPHYLLVLLVVLAAASPRPSWMWLLLPALWLSPGEPAHSPLQLCLAVLASLLVVLGTVLRRHPEQPLARPDRAVAIEPVSVR